MWRFRDITVMKFSPLWFGVAGGVTVTLGLALFPALDEGMIPPIWAWLAALIAAPSVGLLLHLTTCRVIYIKVYFVTTYGLIALVYGGVVWYALISIMGHAQLFVGLILMATLIAIGWRAYLASLHSPERAVMPHEEIGGLNQATGLVDPTHSPAIAREREIQWARSATWLRVVIPVSAALGVWLVRALPAHGDLVLVVIVASAIAIFSMMGAGKNLAFVVASMRWERAHGKHIFINDSGQQD